MKETLKTMLEAGVHFGHQVRRWNAKMAPYIYQEKNGVHILDIVQTVGELEKARVAFKKAKNVIFVGTRPQIAPVIKEVAENCNAHYVNSRWGWRIINKLVYHFSLYSKFKCVRQTS